MTVKLVCLFDQTRIVWHQHFNVTSSIFSFAAAAALGRAVKAGSTAALDVLVIAMRAETERINRAAMHGLSAAGQAAVAALLRLIGGTAPSLALPDSVGAHQRLVAKQCIHALAEALERPNVDAVSALVSFANNSRDLLAECEGSKEKSAAAELRQVVATSMTSLGCIAERGVLQQDVAVCAIIADCLIEVVGSEEVGSEVGGTPDAATAIPELARYVRWIF